MALLLDSVRQGIQLVSPGDTLSSLPTPCPPVTSKARITGRPPHPLHIYMGSRDPNVAPHAYAVCFNHRAASPVPESSYKMKTDILADSKSLSFPFTYKELTY